MERGQREGDLRDDLDPEFMAEMIYSPLYERLVFSYGTLDREFARSVVDAVFPGIAAKRS